MVAQLVKNSPATQETWVPSLVWEDPLEEGMAVYSSFLAWRISWIEEPGMLQYIESSIVPEVSALHWGLGIYPPQIRGDHCI